MLMRRLRLCVERTFEGSATIGAVQLPCPWGLEAIWFKPLCLIPLQLLLFVDLPPAINPQHLVNKAAKIARWLPH